MNFQDIFELGNFSLAFSKPPCYTIWKLTASRDSPAATNPGETTMTDFKRKEWTTQGADPTTVVQWTGGGDWVLTEFQNVYQIDFQGELINEISSVPLEEKVHQLGRLLHQTLEAQYQMEMAR